MSNIKTTSEQKLYRIFSKEIRIMRECLTSLHQEELALLEHAYARFAKILEHRALFVLELKRLREKNERLFIQEELSIETLNLLDQLIALIDRVNLQNARNNALFDQVKQKKESRLYCTYPHPLKRKKKSTVATYTTRE